MEIDLASLTSVGKTVAIGGLSLTAIWALIWPVFKKWFDSLPKTNADLNKPTPTEAEAKEKNPNYDSDKLPPIGFTEHVATLRGVCSYAPPEVQLDYLSQGLTEAKVLKLEVTRMGTPNAPVTRPAETESSISIAKESL